MERAEFPDCSLPGNQNPWPGWRAGLLGTLESSQERFDHICSRSSSTALVFITLTSSALWKEKNTLSISTDSPNPLTPTWCLSLLVSLYFVRKVSDTFFQQHLSSRLCLPDAVPVLSPVLLGCWSCDVSCSCSALPVGGFACLFWLYMSFDNATDHHGACMKAFAHLLIPFLATACTVCRLPTYYYQIFSRTIHSSCIEEKKIKYVLNQFFFTF